MTSPTLDDLNPDKGDLDQQSAAKFFINKSLGEIEESFSVFSFDCAEHLMWMGHKAFIFYFPAALNYLKSVDSEADDIFISMMLAAFELRLTGEHNEYDELQASHAAIADFCAHTINNIAKYETEETLYHDFIPRYEAILSKLT